MIRVVIIKHQEREKRGGREGRREGERERATERESERERNWWTDGDEAMKKTTELTNENRILTAVWSGMSVLTRQRQEASWEKNDAKPL